MRLKRWREDNPQSRTGVSLKIKAYTDIIDMASCNTKNCNRLQGYNVRFAATHRTVAVYNSFTLKYIADLLSVKADEPHELTFL